MKHRELTDHIKGSFLKRQYLEAFLVQSAYIESLLKLSADYSFFLATSKVRKPSPPKILEVVSRNLERMALNDLINFLYKAEVITKKQKDLLDEYRIRRNKMLHDLITEIQKDKFEVELREICEKGTLIIEDQAFIEMADLIDFLEKPQSTENVDQTSQAKLPAVPNIENNRNKETT